MWILSKCSFEHSMFVLAADANGCGWVAAIGAERWKGGEVAWTRGDALQRHAILRSDMNCLGCDASEREAGEIEADGVDGFGARPGPLRAARMLRHPTDLSAPPFLRPQGGS